MADGKKEVITDGHATCPPCGRRDGLPYGMLGFDDAGVLTCENCGEQFRYRKYTPYKTAPVE